MSRSDRILIALIIALGLFTTIMLHASNKVEINELKARVVELEQGAVKIEQGAVRIEKGVVRIEKVMENQEDWIKYFYNKDHY